VPAEKQKGDTTMPIMDVRYPAGSLDKAAKASLAGRLTDVLIKMEGGANTRKGRAFAWVLFTELAEDDFWVGGRTDNEFVAAPGRFLVHVTIPEGYMNAAHKSEVHARVTSAIIEATKTEDHAAGDSVLVVIDEVTEGNWGAGGRTISLDTIADAVGQPKDGTRFKWVRSYYEAKARAYASAGYPPDTGGLLPTLSVREGA
jgi:phenylpyruvate tautomerase PptA (4-oxalocrotonate tautomerase family)